MSTSNSDRPGSSTSYLILHENRGCGAAPSSFLVIRCWYANDDQEVLFTGARSDASEYLRAHWGDPDPRAAVAELPSEQQRTDAYNAELVRRYQTGQFLTETDKREARALLRELQA